MEHVVVALSGCAVRAPHYPIFGVYDCVLTAKADIENRIAVARWREEGANYYGYPANNNTPAITLAIVPVING